MGIVGLNKLIQYYDTKYKGQSNNNKNLKFNTAIIDANNIICIFLNATFKSMKNNNMVNNVIYNPLLYQLHEIIVSTIRATTIYIDTVHKRLTNEHNVILVFDPIQTPKYNIVVESFKSNVDTKNNETNELKLQEQLNRSKVRSDKYKKEVEKLISADIPETSKRLLHQLTHFDNQDNLMKLISIVQNELLYIYGKSEESELKLDRRLRYSDDIQFIQSISEADLTIYNLCLLFNYDSTLIYSRDTDYYVLCADLDNVYKTDALINRPIYNIKDIWSSCFDNKITFDDIISIATICGNDYTAKTHLMEFEISKAKALYELKDGSFSPRCRIIKYLNSSKSLKDIIIQHSQVNPLFKVSLDVYYNRHYNSSFKLLKPNYRKIKNIIDKMLELYNTIYDFEADLDDLKDGINNNVLKCNRVNEPYLTFLTYPTQLPSKTFVVNYN